MTTNKKSAIALQVLKNYIGEQQQRRGTIVMNSYGHDYAYTGSISLVGDKRIKVLQEKNDTDRGIECPISRSIGPNNNIEILYLNKVYDEEKRLIFVRQEKESKKNL